MRNWMIVLVLAIILIALWIGKVLGPDNSAVVVNDFNSCVAAGNPVMESYPRQCRHNDQTYVEDIGNLNEKTDMITLDNVTPGQTLSSPLKIMGQAVGPWYFEANFEIELKDGTGSTIGTAIAEAQSSWMTTSFVPFEATLTFSTPTTSTGTLIFHKANPSGMPANDDQLTIPVAF